METINHECYVSLEVAKLLKQAGFDWKCNGVFLSEDGTQYAFFKSDAACDNNNSKYNPYNISAPTLDVAQRWLREVKLVSVESQVVKWFNRNQTNECSIFWKYIITSIDISSEETFYSIVDFDNGLEFNTYEEALEAGIKKALEIILEKGE